VLTQRSGVTHNYVVIEAEALIHRRHGANPARRLLQDIIPLLDIIWITPRPAPRHFADAGFNPGP
jgi:hypothetical protein